MWHRFEFFGLLFVNLQALQLHLLLQEHIEVDPSQCGGEAGSVLQLLGSITLGPISGKRYFPVSNYYWCVVKLGRPCRPFARSCAAFSVEACSQEIPIAPPPCSSKLGCQSMRICLYLCSCRPFKDLTFCEIFCECFNIFPALLGRVAFNSTERWRHQMARISAEECIDIINESGWWSEATTKL